MSRYFCSLLLSTAIAAVMAGASAALAETNEEIIKNAMSAAPEAVAKDAAVMNWEMKTLREGKNGFTCMPNDPTTPSDDPMCLDKAGMEFFHAMMNKKPPPEGKVGFGYMLKGGTAASNTDPFATEPPGGKWLVDGPHVMIFNAKEMFAAYPRTGENPDPTQPYVMWPGTPYEHLMIPVK
jgi:hypothetical protein